MSDNANSNANANANATTIPSIPVELKEYLDNRLDQIENQLNRILTILHTQTQIRREEQEQINRNQYYDNQFDSDSDSY